MPDRLRLFTPDAQYPDDGTIERRTAGEDVVFDIFRERSADRLPKDLLAETDGIVIWHEMADRRGLRLADPALPDHRPRRGRFRPYRPRGDGQGRHPGLQHAGLRDERGRRSCHRADAGAAPRADRLSQGADAGPGRELRHPLRRDAYAAGAPACAGGSSASSASAGSASPRRSAPRPSAWR